MMRYQQILPVPALQEYIRYFWVLENDAPQLTPKCFKIIPDGNPGLIFQRNHTFFDTCQRPLPGFFLYGQTTRHTQHISIGPFKTIGVYFYPDVVGRIFNLNAAELTDQYIDVTLITSVSEQLLNASSIAHSIDILSAYFISQIKRNTKRENPKVSFCLSEIHQAKGNVSLQAFPRELYISESTFERSFKQAVGISPKLYARITRFQASLNQLRSNGYQQLSDIAFENNYADQSHFIREFKAFTGIVPNYFKRQTKETLANFPELL